MEFANGAVANLTASRISIKNMRNCESSKKMLFFWPTTPKSAPMPCTGRPSWGGWFPQLSIEEFEITEKDSLEEEIGAFVNSVRTGNPPEVDGEEGRKALAVALAYRTGSRTGASRACLSGEHGF